MFTLIMFTVCNKINMIFTENMKRHATHFFQAIGAPEAAGLVPLPVPQFLAEAPWHP